MGVVSKMENITCEDRRVIGEMMNNNMTIESFFLNDYAKVKEEKEQLEKQLFEIKEHQLKVKNQSDGFKDLHTKINLVYVDTNIYYSRLFGTDGKLQNETVEKLRELISKDYKEIANYLISLKSGSYWNVLEIKERTFPFTLEFTTYKGSKIFAYDPDYDDDSLIKFSDSKASINQWVISDLKEECIRLAVESFIEEVNERIHDLETESE